MHEFFHMSFQTCCWRGHLPGCFNAAHFLLTRVPSSTPFPNSLAYIQMAACLLICVLPAAFKKFCPNQAHNSRLPSPCVATAVLTHPRGTCTRRTFHRLHEVLFQKCENNLQNDCLLEVFQEHQIFRNTPRVKSIGYSTMAVFYTLFSIVLTFVNL